MRRGHFLFLSHLILVSFSLSIFLSAFISELVYMPIL